MNGFKRLFLIVFGLAGSLCLAALALPWIGPFQAQATDLMSNQNYFLALEVALGITCAGVLFVLLRGLFTPRQRKTVVIDRAGKDQITVTTAAISSQARHVVEANGRFVAEKVRVAAKKRGGVKVDVRIRPRNTVDISQEGKRLHDDLSEGLSTICGSRVGRINLEFLEAENPDVPALGVQVDEVQIPSSVFERAAQMTAAQDAETPEAPVDVTVPVDPEPTPVPDEVTDLESAAGPAADVEAEAEAVVEVEGEVA